MKKDVLLKQLAKCINLDTNKMVQSEKCSGHNIIEDILTLEPALRTEVSTKLANIVQVDHGANPQLQIASLAPKNISLGIIVADLLKCPFFYLRESKKKHGLKRQIEGKVNLEIPVILFSLNVPSYEQFNWIIDLFDRHRVALTKILSIIGPINENQIAIAKNHQIDLTYLYSSQQLVEKPLKC